MRSFLATFFLITFCLGISFITLPFSLSLAGFWPSVIVMVIAWFYLLITSYYYLEATLSLPDGANVYSISKRYTRGLGTHLNSIFFFIVNYGDLIFYFYFGIPILSEILYRAHFPCPQTLSYLFFGFFLGGAVSLGLKWTLYLNFLFAIVMGIVFYLAFVTEIDMITPQKIYHFRLGFLVLILPSLLNTLYFQTLIPTLVPFLHRNVKKLKSVIIYGLTISCLIFIAWLWIIVSTTSSGFQGLYEIDPSILNFTHLHNIPGFGKWLPLLVILGLSTTTLSSATILVDFISDYFGISVDQRKGSRRMLMTLFLFIPPLFAPSISYSLIIRTLSVISDILSLYLCGLLPIWWIWSLRYEHYEKISPLVPGGKSMLIGFTALSCFIFYLVGLQILYENAI